MKFAPWFEIFHLQTTALIVVFIVRIVLKHLLVIVHGFKIIQFRLIWLFQSIECLNRLISADVRSLFLWVDINENSEVIKIDQGDFLDLELILFKAILIFLFLISKTHFIPFMQFWNLPTSLFPSPNFIKITCFILAHFLTNSWHFFSLQLIRSVGHFLCQSDQPSDFIFPLNRMFFNALINPWDHSITNPFLSINF